jgi:AcrR family transcriptional regulator/DNA-binding transcriptional ArsR family regulator
MATVDRAEAVVGRIARLDSEPARREAVALGLVDALLERDHDTLTAALDALRGARADGDPELIGWLDAAIAFTHWGLERVPSQNAVAEGTQAHEFLTALEGSPRLGSTELRRLLELDETQVSRTGRRLLESGLVTRRKVGRQAYWELTPRGERALEEAPARRSADSEFWQEALSRGFDGERGDVDPTRERIIASALELHGRQGIQATTLAEIADRAKAPLETLEALFPTLDDLARSCGRHLMETLRLPPQDRAPEVFEGAVSEHDRIHRLVETLFGAYERGGEGMAAGRRERRHVPAVDESMGELEHTLDALVVEAVHPRRGDVAALRALTDLEVWRGLRHQGATPEAAVEEASAAVERWLAAR